MIRVLVVDDHAIVRQGLERLLAVADDIELVGSAANGVEAVDLVASTRPDVVLMDLAMPFMDGVQATRRLVDARTGVRVVVLTSFGDDSRIRAALDAGAHGYLLKHTDPDQLIDAVRAAYTGDVPLDPRAGRVLLELTRTPRITRGLSERESEVLGLLADGLANKQIARRLGIRERTVKAHLTNVYQCLGVTDRVQAALWARQHVPD